MSLNGDQIDISSSFDLINATDVTVGSGVEASTDSGDIQIDVVDDDSFNITYTNFGSNITSTTFPNLDFTLSDLDWVDDPNEFIIGVTSTGASVDNISFGTDNITVSVPQLTLAGGESETYSFDITTVCFLPGTNILTAKGEIPIEELNIGDLVETAEGKLEPIKWIGRQTVEPSKVKNSLRSYPILIKAGALGDNVPSRDLYTSPDHSLLVEGLLINAGALVNDITIIKTEPSETFVYYHVELEKHSLLLAEGTHAESYLPQKENRDEYDNGSEYEQLYPHGSNLMLWPMDYPRVSSKNKVPRYVSQKLMKIADELYGQETLKTA